MTFDKYINKFTKNTEKYQTHLSFKNGKYNVPNNKHDEFYKNYYEHLKEGSDLYIIEKVYNQNFAFFLDIDEETSDKNMKTIIEKVKEVITNMCKGDDLDKCVVCKRGQKFHVIFYNLIVNSDIALQICSGLGSTIKVDTSVYRTGLRLIGSQKKNDPSVYMLYDLSSGKYITFGDMSFDDFMKTIVRRKEEMQVVEMVTNVTTVTTEKTGPKKIKVKGIDSQDIINDIANLLKEIKKTNACIEDMDLTIERIYGAQNRLGMFCYYVSVAERFCKFKERHHQRESNPVYLEIGNNGIFVKCYDQDCLRRRYPESGIKFPVEFETRYKQLYLSMSTKYWKTDVSITDDIKRSLEESLNGSHYQIAKAAFLIYKDRFRVDDIKNTGWYEFDGTRWMKSYIMNVLISEELPKYYRGIKISDTSVQTVDLQEFIVNGAQADANLRNQMVDNIILRLENVNFKNNVMNQLIYLFKNHDPEFASKLDANPRLIGFKDGVYDFETNTFRQSNQDDYLTFSTGYDFIEYDESYEQIQEIYDFLKKIIPNNKVLEYLLKVLGKSLIGIPDEKFYIWTGLSGANGKSTLINFLEQTLGDYITSVDVSLLTNKRANSGNASPDIIRMRGARFFSFQEPEHDDKLRTGIMKQFTGGDTIIARELFKSPISFKLQGTMIMCCNDLPTIASTDGGTWRRIRVIEFLSRFCENPKKPNEFKIDPNIKSKIREWRPYFMSILIHWYLKYIKEGLEEPNEVRCATNKYKEENDKFNDFFDQVLEESKYQFACFKDIYAQFQSWWIFNYPSGKKYPDESNLKRALKMKFGEEQTRIIQGVKNKGFNVKIKIDMLNEDDLD